MTHQGAVDQDGRQIGSQVRAHLDFVFPRIGLIEIDELTHELVEIRFDKRKLPRPGELQKGVQNLFQVPAFRLNRLQPVRKAGGRGAIPSR